MHLLVDSLDVIALVLLDQGDHDIASRLAGAASNWRQTHGVPRPLPLQVDYESALVRFRTELGDNDFMSSRSAGIAMPAERAAAWYLALSN